MLTFMDLQPIVARIQALSRNAHDPDLRLAMTILRETIRFMEHADPDWRRNLLAELNKKGVPDGKTLEIQFDPLTYQLSIEGVNMDLSVHFKQHLGRRDT
jgi:hypothetical protein